MNLFENSRNASEPGTNLVTLRKQSQFKDLQNRECITGIRTQRNIQRIGEQRLRDNSWEVRKGDTKISA